MKALMKMPHKKLLILTFYFLQFLLFFESKIATVRYELQPTEYTTSSQHQHGVHMMSLTTYRGLPNAGMTPCVHGK